MQKWWLPFFLACVLALFGVQVSHACSAEPDFDPVAQSDIIVGGRVSSWQPLTTTAKVNDAVPIEVTLSVDEAYKGSVQGTLTFVDRSSRQAVSTTEVIWVGDAGSCGAFSDDPTNSYVILGLVRQADGTYQSNLLRTFFSGADPQGSTYQSALKRLAVQPSTLPATGTDQRETSAELFHAPTLIGFGLLLILIGGVVLSSRAYYLRTFE